MREEKDKDELMQTMMLIH